MQNTVLRHFVHIQNQKDYTNGKNRQRTPGNQKIIKHNKSEDLPEYIWSFTHLFNKKKFEKLLERQE